MNVIGLCIKAAVLLYRHGSHGSRQVTAHSLGKPGLDQFHDAICYQSRRNVIIDTVVPLMRKTRRYRRLAMDDWDRVPKTKQEHYEIFRAIASGNAELAEELTTKHISNAKIHMLEGMKNNG